MSVRVSLTQSTVSVVAGRSQLVGVRVTNTGSASRWVRLDVSGRAAPWVRLAADVQGDVLDRDGAGAVALDGGASADLSLLVSPPRSGAPSEQMVPFTVRALDPDGGATASATGLVVVQNPVPITAALAPESMSGHRRSRHVLHLTTDDAAGVLVTLRGVPARRARVTVDPVAVRVEPGAPSQAQVTVEAAPVLRRRRHDVEVVWETTGPDGLVRGAVGARFDQTPVLPPSLSLLLGVALVAALVLGGRPLVTSRLDDPAGPGQTGPDGPVATTEPPTRPFAVVGVRLKDPNPAATLAEAEEEAAAVPAGAGRRARVVDGAQVPGLESGFWLVVVEGFADARQAADYCREREPADCSVVT